MEEYCSPDRSIVQILDREGFPFSERPSTPQRQIASTVSYVGTWQQFGVTSHSRLDHQYCCLGSLWFRGLKFYDKNLRLRVSAT